MGYLPTSLVAGLDRSKQRPASDVIRELVNVQCGERVLSIVLCSKELLELDVSTSRGGMGCCPSR